MTTVNMFSTPGRRMANSEKATLIAEIRAGSSDPVMKSMLNLIELLINELRTANDTAEEKEVYRNQGSIRVLELQKGYISRDMPTTGVNS